MSDRVGEAFWTQVNRFWILDMYELKEEPENRFPYIAFMKSELICNDIDLMVEGGVSTEIKFEKLKLILDDNATVSLLNLETQETTQMSRKDC